MGPLHTGFLEGFLKSWGVILASEIGASGLLHDAAAAGSLSRPAHLPRPHALHAAATCPTNSFLMLRRRQDLLHCAFLH